MLHSCCCHCEYEAIVVALVYKLEATCFDNFKFEIGGKETADKHVLLLWIPKCQASVCFGFGKVQLVLV